MSASIWCLNEDSARSTPAKKAPIAIESPLICIKRAEPRTTSKAAAVITSRACASASNLNRGLITHLPTITKRKSPPKAIPMVSAWD